MAVIKDIETIFKVMDREQYRIYEVTDMHKRKLFQQIDDNMLVDRAVAQLRDDLNSTNGTVVVKVKKKFGAGGNARDMAEFEVSLGEANKPGSNFQPQPVNGITSDQLKEILTEERTKILAEFQKDQEIANLKQQIKELKEGTLTDKLIQGVAPMLINRFVGSPQGPVQPIAGTPNEPPLEPTDMVDVERNQKITVAIDRLIQVDENFADHITKLADMAENNRQMYDMAIQMLNQQ